MHRADGHERASLARGSLLAPLVARSSCTALAVKMARAITALFLVPFSASILFGPLSILAAIILLGVAAVFAFPLFIWFVQKRWLRLWQVTGGGLACALPAVIYEQTHGPSTYHEINGPANLVLFLGLGAAIAAGFWLTGLFRNPWFPSVPREFPTRTASALGALGFMATWLYIAWSPTYVGGRIVAGGVPPGFVSSIASEVTLRIGDGDLVTARVPHAMPLPVRDGDCVFALRRRSLNVLDDRYWVTSFKSGPAYDDC